VLRSIGKEDVVDDDRNAAKEGQAGGGEVETVQLEIIPHGKQKRRGSPL